MRRITLWLMSTLAAVVLLFSYRTSTGGTAVTAAPGERSAVAPAPSASAGTGSAGTGSSGGGRAGGGSAGGGSSGGSTTYKGSVAQTRWGPIQVTVTVSGGKITDVAVPVHPNGNHRDEEINAVALPALRQEVLDAQSARIDTVSGATVTSDGYVESLQAALDSAHLS